VVAKHLDRAYEPGKRTGVSLKYELEHGTGVCDRRVCAGHRWHRVGACRSFGRS
jgi:hypothetical protein